MKYFEILVVSTLIAATAFAQKPKPAVKTTKPIIFAVLNDGKTLEPIAYVNKGKLEAPVNGSDDSNIIAAFNKTYYKPGTVYRFALWRCKLGNGDGKKLGL